MRILITGASRGLGLYLASHFAEQGHTVVGCARSASEFTHERYRHMQFDATDDMFTIRALSDARSRRTAARVQTKVDRKFTLRMSRAFPTGVRAIGTMPAVPALLMSASSPP